jgi:hypothetical protein
MINYGRGGLMSSKKLIFLQVLFLFIGSRGFAEGTIGIGTELKFPADANGFGFSKCRDDAKSSCVVLEKIEHEAPMYKEMRICTLKVKNANIAKLDTESARTLRVSQVVRDDSNNVVLVVLEGAKLPVLLSCGKELTQGAGKHYMPNFPLTTNILSGLPGFTLGTVLLDKVPSAQTPKPTVKPPVPALSGGVI